jgi:hypothetical protein
MATLLKGKDAQRNPKTGLELGICAATIPGLNPGFTLAHNIMPEEFVGLSPDKLLDGQPAAER